MADDQFPRKSKKARVSVTIDESLVADAKKFGYNISETAQKALELKVKTERMRRWSAENREAIKSWSRDIEENGLWSDGLRLF
ncbi:MAG: type II toxin-antitoxin system CcdA family antitoxin [Hyphomonadaceae bacterium]